MTPDSQLRLCRAGIIIGVLFCVAAVFEVGIGWMGMLRGYADVFRNASQEPERGGNLL